MWDLEADIIDHGWTTDLKPTCYEIHTVHKALEPTFSHSKKRNNGILTKSGHQPGMKYGPTEDILIQYCEPMNIQIW